MSIDFELGIIGGGIHGAAVANYAAQSGISTILLEKNDFASGTSSRSSKMAHGGLRYLEMFDFKQVLEGIASREELYLNASAICRPYPFLIPVSDSDYLFRLKLGAGLIFYDWLNKEASRRHKFLPEAEFSKHPEIRYQQRLMGYFRYYDGILNDTELVFAHLSKALEYSAQIHNYQEVVKIVPEHNKIQLHVQEKISKRQKIVKVRYLINTAGVHSGEVLHKSSLSDWPLRFSRGSHILFDKKWEAPALFLPLSSKARYYFVWPHFAGTLVGTTEREIAVPVDDPIPSADELAEIFANLKKDLPDSGLTEKTAHYCFAGTRVLPARSQGNTALLSRRHIWQLNGNILSLHGGKLTTAAGTAREGLKKIFSGRIVIKDLSLAPVFTAESTLSQKTEIAIRKFKAVTLKDLMQRRLFLEYLPGNGISQIEEVVSLAAQSGLKISPMDVVDYKEMMNKIRKLLKAV